MNTLQIYLLGFSCLVLQGAVFALCLLTPGETWYTVSAALLTGAYTSLTVGKLWGWLR